MAFIHINTVDVRYHGKILPRDAAPLKVFVPDPNVDYANNTLPGGAPPPLIPFTDPTNNPKYLVIGPVVLPPDSKIEITNKKIVVLTHILDGPSVFERISREPADIEIECVLRMQNQGGVTFYNTNNQPPGLAGPVADIFPVQYMEDIWNQIWLPDSVQTVNNSYLNKLNISQLVIEHISAHVQRGSTNILLHLKCFENVPGQSLIIG